MDRRDYVLRTIEQFGELARALRVLILGGSRSGPVVRERLAGVARQAGLDLELALMASLDTLALLVAPGGEVEPGRCWMAAETLYLDGLDAACAGETARARASLTKARALFALVAPYGAFLVGFPEGAERIAEIDERLAGLGGAEPGGAGRPRRRAVPGRGRRPTRRRGGPAGRGVTGRDGRAPERRSGSP